MPYAGFDKLTYPGDQTMAWLKANTNLRFVGFYLAPAPSRPTSGWMKRRATLAAQGWGFAPVYVGQQEEGQPGSHVLTAKQGKTDADDATALMQTAGFANNTIAYLDLEQGGPASTRTKAYVGAWIDQMKANGKYRPGVYCSYTTAASLNTLRPNTPTWVWHIDVLPVPGPNYPPNLPASAPAGSGVSHAVIWQHAQNKKITLKNGPVPTFGLDLNCSSKADPSL